MFAGGIGSSPLCILTERRVVNVVRRRRSEPTPSLSRGPLDLAPCDPAHDGNASASVRCRYHRHRALVGAHEDTATTHMYGKRQAEAVQAL